MIVIQPPKDKFFDRELCMAGETYDKCISPRPRVFLAGSIEMGTAAPWQAHVINELKDLNGTIWNPRRDDWDSSWEQSIDNDKFLEQVCWELEGLDHADIVLMYFDPQTKSPVTMMELAWCRGDFGHQQAYSTPRSLFSDVCVCCPQGFWRKGNVDIVSRIMGVRTEESIEDMLAFARRRISEFKLGTQWVDYTLIEEALKSKGKQA